MKRVGWFMAIGVAAAVAGCSTSAYDKQFENSLQQYRADSAAGRKGRAVARPMAVQGEGGAVIPGDGQPPADGAVPPGAVPPGAVPPGAVPPAPQ